MRDVTTMTQPPLATTTLGIVRGCVEDGLCVFRGVPYAAPPVGPARWQAARPHPGWAGVRDATRYGASAPQPWRPDRLPVIGRHGEPPFDEDCLTLNVWTPGTDSERRPVLVWIHGGGFLTGSGNLPFYAGDTFARNGDIVAISINYRLGPLGFLPGLGDANAWLTDQVAALQWIAGNVAAFGGDPARITVAGQSGGAFSVAALAQHPGSRHLFQRGILQSPPAGLALPARQDAIADMQALARQLGHADPEALRGEPWERLIGGTIGIMIERAGFGKWGLAFVPVIDEVTMPRDPMLALADSDIDLIIGWTSDEASFAFGLDPAYAATTREQVIAWAAGGHGEQAAALYETHAAARPGRRPLDVLIQIFTDDFFRRGSLRLAAERAGSRPVRAYQFEVRSRFAGGVLGAPHCMELPFTFASVTRWGDAPFVQDLPPEVIERASGMLHNAWIDFVRSGNHRGNGIADWRPYTTGDPAVLVITDDGSHMETGAPSR
ncbi:MAG TPA: carboxylesterase family protein [Streptosporangiaceae bacterium]|nr:carboxylesterase family protein [Streptosporangiaceae bacterium]